MTHGLAACVIVLCAATAPAHAQARDTPSPLGRALHTPAWLTVAIEQQTRAEHLSHDFRAGSADDATALSLRTSVAAEAHTARSKFGLELLDARMYASDDLRRDTTHANPLDVLQAYAGVALRDALHAGDRIDVRAGRMTIDLGSRRLVARNAFRTTINAFTGVDAGWTSARDHVVRVLAVLPVTRLPSDPEGLADNAFERDEENTDALLWGAFHAVPANVLDSRLELYVLGFHERDGERASRNRQLVTLGARWLREPAPGQLDFELEVMPQLGRARATTAIDDTTDLAHRALATHAELGINPALAGSPRIALVHDYASGDGDARDDRSGRFDTLFGARRFELGPTGLFGPFARSNIQSPGVRISGRPTRRLDAFVAYRLYWLASANDAWTTAGIRDATGASTSFVGEQVELRVRIDLVPKTLRLELGAAYVRRGQFAKFAPDTRLANPAYAYTQLTVRL